MSKNVKLNMVILDHQVVEENSQKHFEFIFSCRTAMRQRASGRSTLQHSQTKFFRGYWMFSHPSEVGSK
eukprot:UN07119